MISNALRAKTIAAKLAVLVLGATLSIGTASVTRTSLFGYTFGERTLDLQEAADALATLREQVKAAARAASVYLAKWHRIEGGRFVYRADVERHAVMVRYEPGADSESPHVDEVVAIKSLVSYCSDVGLDASGYYGRQVEATVRRWG